MAESNTEDPRLTTGKAQTGHQGRPWYHASHHEFLPGDVLTPQPPKGRNFRSSRPGVVSITNMHEIALHWGRKIAERAGADHFHVYEVEPLGQITPWRLGDGASGNFQEVHVPQARVRRLLFGHGVDELPEPEKTLGGGDQPWSSPPVRFSRDPVHGGWVKSQEDPVISSASKRAKESGRG